MERPEISPRLERGLLRLQLGMYLVNTVWGLFAPGDENGNTHEIDQPRGRCSQPRGRPPLWRALWRKSPLPKRRRRVELGRVAQLWPWRCLFRTRTTLAHACTPHPYRDPRGTARRRASSRIPV